MSTHINLVGGKATEVEDAELPMQAAVTLKNVGGRWLVVRRFGLDYPVAPGDSVSLDMADARAALDQCPGLLAVVRPPQPAILVGSTVNVPQ